MTALARINRFISRLEDSLLIGLVAGLLLVAVAQIILRNVFGAGLLWADPAMRIAVLWIAMVGGMVACREGGHIKINLFDMYAIALQNAFRQSMYICYLMPNRRRILQEVQLQI